MRVLNLPHLNRDIVIKTEVQQQILSNLLRGINEHQDAKLFSLKIKFISSFLFNHKYHQEAIDSIKLIDEKDPTTLLIKVESFSGVFQYKLVKEVIERNQNVQFDSIFSFQYNVRGFFAYYYNGENDKALKILDKLKLENSGAQQIIQ